MVTRRIRSEYMKKFKDPKWETYTRCYEEMLRYRLTRRLLEQSHNPWFWNGSDTDSDSGERSPLPPSKNQVQAETIREEAELGKSEGQRVDRTIVPRLLLQDEVEDVNDPAVNGKSDLYMIKKKKLLGCIQSILDCMIYDAVHRFTAPRCQRNKSVRGGR